MNWLKKTFGKLLACFRLILVIGLIAFHGLWVALLPETKHRARAQAIKSFGRSLTWALGICIKQVGQPDAQAGILISNHRSYADIPVLSGISPVVFLAKAELQAWPVIGFAARKARTVFVDRQDPKSRENSRRLLKERLAEGFSVLVFSEGTTTARGTLAPLKPGMFHEAVEADLPIQLVYIEFAEDEDSWVDDHPVSHHFFDRFSRRRTEVKVLYRSGLMYPPQQEDKTHAGHALCEQAKQWFHEQIRNEIGELREGSKV